MHHFHLCPFIPLQTYFFQFRKRCQFIFQLLDIYLWYLCKFLLSHHPHLIFYDQCRERNLGDWAHPTCIWHWLKSVNLTLDWLALAWGLDNQSSTRPYFMFNFVPVHFINLTNLVNWQEYQDIIPSSYKWLYVLQIQFFDN